jgi:HTH-type transcriptional regulator/antitoxin HigA
MEQHDLAPADLAPILGTRSRVSEVLNGKRPLTLNMIRRLHRQLGIPAALLIAASPAAAA